MKKTILYIRVSTDEQKNEGYSLEYQEMMLLKYCKENGITNYEIYDDGGFSGFSSKRPHYQKMLKEMEQGIVENVIFLKIDRMSRNVIDYSVFYQMAQKHEVRLISLTETLETTAIGELMQLMMVAMGQLHVKQTSERTIYSQIMKLEKGLYPYGGNMPLGLSKNEEGKLYYNDEIVKVKEVFSLYEEGFSLAYITDWFSKRHKKWIDKDYIGRLINNPIYKGYYYHKGLKKRYKLIEGIVKPDLEKNRSRRCNREFKYPLKEFITGSKFTCSTKVKRIKSLNRTKEYKYYVCREKDIILSEDKFFGILQKKIKIGKRNLNNARLEAIKKLNELYVTSDMTRDDYDEYKINLKEKYSNKCFSSKLRNIYIKNDGDIEVELRDESRIRFNYYQETS